MKEEAPQDALARCIARLGELLAPILNAPRQADETINGYGVIDACGHAYMPDGSPYTSPQDLSDAMFENIARARRLRAKSSSGRAGEKAPGCSICMIERHRQILGKLLHWRLN